MTNRTDKAFELLRHLVGFDSTSCHSNLAISEAIALHLEELGFAVSLSKFTDGRGVEKANIEAVLAPHRRSAEKPGLGYFCHSDVVPASDWSRDNDPYELVSTGDKWFGRGACDMKGSIVCLLEAVASIDRAELSAPFFFICTADEEVGFGGAKHFVRGSEMYGDMVSHQVPAVVGEPTSLRVVHAHKGICGLRAVSRGRSAHSSSSDGLNANLAMIPFLGRVLEIREETLRDLKLQHEEFRPPDVSWNIGINDFNYAPNITASKSVCTIFFRPMPDRDVSGLIAKVESAARECGLEFEVEMQSAPFYTDPTRDFITTAVRIAEQQRSYTVAYGTDGGELTQLDDMIVFGPGDIAQAHTSDEWIAVDQIERGITMYERFVRHYC